MRRPHSEGGAINTAMAATWWQRSHILTDSVCALPRAHHRWGTDPCYGFRSSDRCATKGAPNLASIAPSFEEIGPNPVNTRSTLPDSGPNSVEHPTSSSIGRDRPESTNLGPKSSKSGQTTAPNRPIFARIRQNPDQCWQTSARYRLISARFRPNFDRFRPNSTSNAHLTDSANMGPN